MMRNHGGFEGNGQTFRIVTNLEPYTEFNGMNLTRRTLLGLLKYPQTLAQLTNMKLTPEKTNFRQLKASEWHPPKGLYCDDEPVIDWLLQPLSVKDKALFQQVATKEKRHHKTCFKSIDCSIMELADDIAYGIHDLEDAIVTGIVTRTDFQTEVINKLLKLDDKWLHGYSQTLLNNLFSDEHHLTKRCYRWLS